MTELSDEKIAEAIQSGEAEAFGEITSRYELKLKRYARRFLSLKEDVDDLVQDVFIKAYTNIQSFDPSLRFSPWIYRIAHNTFVNELKRKQRVGFGVFDADIVLPFLPAKETSDADTLNEELKVEMEKVIDKLSPKYREVVVLHYYEELSYAEISDVLRISVSSVGVRMTRARQKLRELYNEENN